MPRARATATPAAGTPPAALRPRPRTRPAPHEQLIARRQRTTARSMHRRKASLVMCTATALLSWRAVSRDMGASCAASTPKARDAVARHRWASMAGSGEAGPRCSASLHWAVKARSDSSEGGKPYGSSTCSCAANMTCMAACRVCAVPHRRTGTPATCPSDPSCRSAARVSRARHAQANANGAELLRVDHLLVLQVADRCLPRSEVVGGEPAPGGLMIFG